MDLKKVGIAVTAILIALWILGKVLAGPSRSSATSAATPPDQIAVQDKWQAKEDRSPMDDSRTVILALDSDEAIEGPIGSNKPTLIVRCKEGNTQVYVATGMAASIEEDIDGGPTVNHKVRVRLDNGNPGLEYWYESTDHKALFTTDGVEYAKQLAAAHTFTFEFTPFDGSPQVARFDVWGLRDHLNKVADACNWHVR